MAEAVHMTASSIAVWAIVVVGVAVIVFWVSAIMIAGRRQAREGGKARMPGETEPRSNARAGGSVPGEESAKAPGEAVHERIAPRGRHARTESVPQGEVPTRVDLRAQPAAPGRHEMPGEQAGDAGRAARS